MKPDLALSLSFDGIRLLVRTAEGATSLGEVSLDSPDLAGDLAALLRRGREAEVPWTGATLLLPPEQVKVLALDGERGEVEVLKALDGTTPYSLADLVVDFRAAQGRTHVAAVARETLEEAEAFAAGHGFQPVRFAALLEALGFPGEADFGPTRLALSAGATGDAGRVGLGAAVATKAPAMPMDELVGSATVEGGPREAPLDAMREQAADSGPFPAQGEAVVAEVPLTGTGTSQARQRAGAVSAPAQVATPAGTPAPGSGTSSDRTAARRDHSTRSGSDAPIRATLGSPEPARTQGEPTRQADGASRPLRRISFAAASPEGRRTRAAKFGGLGLKRSLESFAAPVAGRRWTSALVLTPVIVAALSAAGIVAAVGLGPVAGLVGGSELVDNAAAPTVEAAPAAAALAVAAPEVATAATLLDEPVPDSARVMPAAGGLEAAAPAAGTVDAAAAAAAAAAVAAALATEPAQDPSPAAERVVQQAVALPAAPGSAGPTAADHSAATTGAWLSAPRLPVLPSGSREEETAPSVVATSEAKALSDLPLLAGLAPDPSPSWPSDAPASGTESEQPVLAAAEPEAAPSTSSVVVEAGSPAVVPPSRPGGLAPVADGVTPSEWINALVEPPAVLPRARPDVSAEVLAALRLRSANGEDGTENPADGALAPAASGTELAAAEALILDGLRPALRPGDFAPSEPPVQILASFEGPRPGPRPEGLAPEPPEAPDVTGALAEALAETEAPAAPDLQSTLAAIVEGAPDPLAGSTRLAVASARVPESRPRSFDRVVREQLERVASARAAQEERPAGGARTAGLEREEVAEADGDAEVASGAAAVPSGPTATTVAAAVTLSDAMALREINLIGVYGQPGARRALVRMDNGRYLRVGIGDDLNGGRVTAIGDNALNYVRRGRTEVLVIPGG